MSAAGKDKTPAWVVLAMTGQQLAGPFSELRAAKRFAARSKLPVKLVNSRNGRIDGWYSGEVEKSLDVLVRDAEKKELSEAVEQATELAAATST